MIFSMKQIFFLLLLARLLISRVVGGKATVFRESWYRDAQHSPATPPDWVFGVAWPLNYATSSWAAAIFASKTAGAERYGGILLWLCQTVVTSVWTRIFGDLKRPDWALQSLILSWLLSIATAKKFAKTSPAGFWMIPLCVWLTLAIELNTEFLVRNPDRLNRRLKLRVAQEKAKRI
jgi:translocator protein